MKHSLIYPFGMNMKPIDREEMPNNNWIYFLVGINIREYEEFDTPSYFDFDYIM